MCDFFSETINSFNLNKVFIFQFTFDFFVLKIVDYFLEYKSPAIEYIVVIRQKIRNIFDDGFNAFEN